MKEQVADILAVFNSLQDTLNSMSEKVDGLETKVHQFTRGNKKIDQRKQASATTSFQI